MTVEHLDAPGQPNGRFWHRDDWRLNCSLCVRLTPYRQLPDPCECSFPREAHPGGYRWAPAGEMEGPNYRHHPQVVPPESSSIGRGAVQVVG